MASSSDYARYVTRRRKRSTQFSGPGVSPPPTTTQIPPASDSEQTPAQVTDSQPSVAMGGVMSLEELISQPGRERLRMLDPDCNGPNSTWFGFSGNGISKCMLKMMHNLLKEPYPTFASMPKQDQEIWFRQFAQEFNWESVLTNEVRKAFEKAVCAHYSKTLNEWKSRWLNGQPVRGVDVALLERFGTYWEQPTTKEISATHSKNRLSDRGGKGIATHNAGAVSSKTRAEQLFVRDGVYPDHLTLMEDIHTNRKTKQIQDPIAREIIESVKLKKQAILSQQSLDGSSSSNDLPADMINKIILEETPTTRGRTFGLGNLAQSTACSSSGPLHSGYHERMQKELEERDQKIAHLETTVSTLEQKIQEGQQQMQSQFERYMEELRSAIRQPTD